MRREGTISANWKDSKAGMIFCQEGHSGVLAEGRGLPQSVCTFSEAFDSGPNSLSCAKAGVMDGKCLLARLTGSSNRGCWGSARSFPSAGKFSFLSWSKGACQNSNSQGSPELLMINHLFWSFCLLEFFTQMGNEWWWCRASYLAQRMGKNSSTGVNGLLPLKWRAHNQMRPVRYHFIQPTNYQFMLPRWLLWPMSTNQASTGTWAWQANQSPLWPLIAWHWFTYAEQGAYLPGTTAFPQSKKRSLKLLLRVAPKEGESFF